MAYGQTGTGKTYTLGQLGKDDASQRGIMVRALEDIITSASPASDSVEISYLQVLLSFIHLPFSKWYFLTRVVACFSYGMSRLSTS